MKRILAVLLGALVSVSAFAQTESRKLIAGVYDFVTVKSKDWTVIEPDFQFIDTVTETIVFSASFVEKRLPGFREKYDFTCTVSRTNNDFDVDITELTSFLCDTNLKPTAKKDQYTWTSVTQDKYEKKMKDEISKRMSKWSDAEYEKRFNDAVTSPLVLTGAARSNTIAFKNFIKDYQIVGRSVTTQVYTMDVHEDSKTVKGYSYCVNGKGLCGHIVCSHEEINSSFALRVVYTREPQYADVTVYTNSNKVISLSPARRKAPVNQKDAQNNNVQDGYDVSTGSVYTIKGTIKDVTQNDSDATNKIAAIVITE